MFGLSKRLKEKQRSKYNLEVEQEVVQWVNRVVPERQISGGSPESLQQSLQNGDVLCRLINNIKAGSVNNKIFLQKLNTSGSDFSAFENIANKQRITAAVTAFKRVGVPETSTFRAEDLTDGKDMTAVLQCVYMLGRICNKNGYPGALGGILATGSDHAKGRRSTFTVLPSSVLPPPQSSPLPPPGAVATAFVSGLPSPSPSSVLPPPQSSALPPPLPTPTLPPPQSSALPSPQPNASNVLPPPVMSTTPTAEYANEAEYLVAQYEQRLQEEQQMYLDLMQQKEIESSETIQAWRTQNEQLRQQIEEQAVQLTAQNAEIEKLNQEKQQMMEEQQDKQSVGMSVPIQHGQEIVLANGQRLKVDVNVHLSGA